MVAIMLGAAASVNTIFDDRGVFYKQHNSNFYSALSYVLGQVAALVPSMLIDAAVLGSLLYWMVGLRATADAFIIYLLFFLTFNMLMLQLFNTFVAVAPNKSLLAAACTVTIFFNTLFCGFIVTPDVIPVYWKWLYWMLPSAWVYRGLVLNLRGETNLVRHGFVLNGKSFTKQWIGYGFAFVIASFLLATIVAALCLQHLRMEESQKSSPNVPRIGEDKEVNDANIESLTAFTPVDLSFHDLCYEVKASKGSEKLRLLKSVSGIFKAGRMCALMVSNAIVLFIMCPIVIVKLMFFPNSFNSLLRSGRKWCRQGMFYYLTIRIHLLCFHFICYLNIVFLLYVCQTQTTLMDVITLRKGSALSFRSNVGITGDVFLNGFPQEKN